MSKAYTKKELQDIMDKVNNDNAPTSTESKKDNINKLHVDKSIQVIPDGMEKSFRITDEGYLKGQAIVTNIGAFPYKYEDGVKIELRLQDDVYNIDSLQSLKMLPITNGHQAVITADNIKEYQIGTTGSKVFLDGTHVAVEMIITDKDTVQEILVGKRALSCGYQCDLEIAPKQDSVWLGIPYDYIQKNIRYNHVAVVPKGRAGDAVEMKFDGAGVGGQAIIPKKNKILADKIDEKKTNDNIGNKDRSDIMTKKLNLDGVVYEVDAEVADAIQSLRKDKEGLEKANAEAKAKMDTLQAEFDAGKEKMDELEKTVDDTAKIDEQVNIKLDLLVRAKQAKVEVDSKKSNDEIMRAVILKIQPKADLSEKSDVYIKARYDSVCEKLDEMAETTEKSDKTDAESREALNPTGDKTDSITTVDKAYNDMVDDMEKRSREVIK